MRLRTHMKPRYLTALSIILLVCLLCPFIISQQRQTPLTAEQQALADYIKANYTKREVMIPMRDGIKLFTSIYEPKDASQKYPILMDRTCYAVRPYGPDMKPSLGPNDLFAKEGYIFV